MKTECPYCHQYYEVDEQYSSCTVNCPGCGKNFIIPGGSFDMEQCGGNESVRKRNKSIPFPSWMKNYHAWLYLALILILLEPLIIITIVILRDQLFQIVSGISIGIFFIIFRLTKIISVAGMLLTYGHGKWGKAFITIALLLPILSHISPLIMSAFISSQGDADMRVVVSAILSIFSLFSWLISAGIIVSLFIKYKLEKRDKLPPPSIICPNLNCHYTGPGKKDGGAIVFLLVILFLLGIIPGILYLLLAGKQGVICPQCGIRIR